MANTLYQLYLKKVFDLANTLVVKLDAIAEVINVYVKAYGFPVDENNRATWKYYMNLAGLYHPLDLYQLNLANGGGTASSRLLIKIAGTAGPIDAEFTTNLIDPVVGDISIANEYRYGTEYYQDLVRRYPEHEDLILGILNPIPLSISINSADGALLYCGGYRLSVITDGLGTRTYYQKTQVEGRDDVLLIEDNESNLIDTIQHYINSVLVRWHNPDYAKPDEYYIHSVLGVLYANLPLRILNARLANCHTPMVHSYHVEEFLESHGYLGRYSNIIPLKQRLFLYRNLNYIEANAGKQSTMDLLIDNLLTPLKIPIAGYTLQHQMLKNPTTVVPTVVAVRNHINFKQAGSGDDTIDVDELLRREIPLARENRRDILAIGRAIDEQVATANTNFLPTKVLESAMLDTSDRLPFPFSNVLLNLWLYTAATGTYTGTIFVTNPATADRLHLTPLNAFILMVYCINRGWADTALTTIPHISARLIPKATLPTVAELKYITERQHITDADLAALTGTQGNPNFTFNSSDNFYTGARAIHTELMRRYHVYVQKENLDARAQLEMACSLFYNLETDCTLSTLSYDDWLHLNGIVLDNLDRDQFVTLALEIIKQATGNRENNNEYLNQLQKAIIAILKQFSSYTVQFIRSINDGPARMVDPKTIRLGNIGAYQRALIRLPVATIYTTNVGIHANSHAVGFTNPNWVIRANTV